MDLDKVRAKLKKLSNAGKSGGNLWRPEVGETTVRIVPYIHNPEWPFLEMYFHYNLAKKTIVSPKSFGNPDPVQEFADKLMGTGDNEDWKMGRNIEPKQRIYVPILVRGKESEGVKFWGFGKKVYEQLLQIIADPEYGDISDLKDGTDITITYEAAADGGYPTTSLRMKRNTSPATTDKKVVELLKQMPSREEIWEEPTYEEVKELLQKFISNEGEEEKVTDDSMSEEEFSDFLDNKGKGTSAKEAVANIDAAFDDMFN